MSEPDQSSSIQAQLRDVKTTSTVAGAKEGPHVESPLVPSDALATQHAPINQETSLHPVGKTPQPVISKPPGSESMLSRPKPRILVPWSGKSGEAIRLTGDLRDALIGLGAELVDVPPGERLGYGLTSLFLTVDVVVFPLIDIDTEDHIVRACLSVAEEFGGSSVTRVPVALIPWTPLQESVPEVAFPVCPATLCRSEGCCQGSIGSRGRILTPQSSAADPGVARGASGRRT